MTKRDTSTKARGSKRAYRKPKLQSIELVADEVLGVGCKLSTDTLAFGDNPCTLEVCFSTGS